MASLRALWTHRASLYGSCPMTRRIRAAAIEAVWTLALMMSQWEACVARDFTTFAALGSRARGT
eukprot:11002902-Alexandrium_andersonii.AAC.1